MAKEGPRAVSADPDTTTTTTTGAPLPSRSKFDLEPNPFEQSFRSGDEHHQHHHHHTKRARSISPTYTPGGTLRPASFVRGTPRGDATNQRTTGKVSLPGIAWIASPTLPAGTGPQPAHQQAQPSSHHPDEPHQAVNERGPGPLTALGWGLSSSLRSGPLSPALLSGPKDGSSSLNPHHAHHHHPHPLHHHPAHHPSGLTPFLSGGPTGAGGSGGQTPHLPTNSGAFTPGTQALFNMITTSGATPNVSMPATLSSLTDAIPVTSSLSTKPVPVPSSASSGPTGSGAGHTQAAPRSFTDVQRTMIGGRPGGQAPGAPSNTSSASAIPTTGVRGGPAFATEAPLPSLPPHVLPSVVPPVVAPPLPQSTSTSTASRDREGDFSSNPLYLLSAAQEAATHHAGGGGRGVKRHQSGSEEALDDAAVVAAAALTGLGTPGGHHSLHHPHHLSAHPASVQGQQAGGGGGYFPYAPPHPPQAGGGGGGGQGGYYQSAGATTTGSRYLPHQGEAAPPSAFSNGLANIGPPGSNGRGGGPASTTTTRGRKRKAVGASPPANGGGTGGKRGRGGGARGTGRKAKASARMDLDDEEPDDDDDDDDGGDGGMMGGIDEDVGDDDEDDDGGGGGEFGGGGGRGGKGKGGAGQAQAGRFETDDEKRKNFLERNRQAALKCRQRKKAWLANLQAKVEYLTSENDGLQSNIAALREEIGSLRDILLAHKDCPIAISGGPVLDGPPAAAAASNKPAPDKGPAAKAGARSYAY